MLVTKLNKKLHLHLPDCKVESSTNFSFGDLCGLEVLWRIGCRNQTPSFMEHGDASGDVPALC